MRSQHEHKAFTLIELLIVVAIIAILAAIAVPNFLEAQIRAKVSRVKADQRTIATAIESYMVDHSTYPPNNNGVSNFDPTSNPVARRIMPALSTPIAYIASALHTDPFGRQGDYGVTFQTTYDYFNASGSDFLGNAIITIAASGPPGPFTSIKYVDNVRSNQWFLFSAGPDRSTHQSELEVIIGGDPENPGNLAWIQAFAQMMVEPIVYDPSNGTLSPGDVIRTAKGIFEPKLVGL